MKRDRLLIFGHSSLHKRGLVTHLDPTSSSATDGDTAIHPITLKTKYYTSSIDVWIDDSDDLDSWTMEYCGNEAREVRDVINGLVYCSDVKDFDSLEKELGKVRRVVDVLDEETEGDEEEKEDEGWGGLKVCVLFGGVKEDFEDYEDVCLANGWECIQLDDKRDFNEFKERVGPMRFKEVVESHGWADNDAGESEADDEDAEDFDLIQMVDMLKKEKDRLASLPDHEREEAAKKFIESLSL
ncbi:CYFA0S02e05710g1_1 [Cyberlindnera fabianii]|uniref:Increased recombination centers protein 6 n=1 Tax=Cyberlindnera fabianii TaxID=36022 RepID=A0A061AMF4_CYBFA|nr:CYFA0S02e05710g1_1 [Cyberlindnera fabianii]